MSRQFTPEQAVERYINERQAELSDSTIYNYKSNLGLFTEWCHSQSDIDYIRDIDQFHVSDYKMHRREEDDINDATVYGTMMALRTFIKWCESKGLPDGVAENIILPSRDGNARTEVIDADTAEQILDYMAKYEYATYQHVAFALMWDCGLRIGAVRAIDLGDYHSDGAYVELHHRPEDGDSRGTPLKNAEDSEREVNLHQWVVKVIDDYIEGRRHDVTDKFGWDSLLTTKRGRPARTTLRRHIMARTRPCCYSDTYPVGRDIPDCVANSWEKASDCPDLIKPHSVRRSSITAWLDDGHSKELVSDRMDVSPDVLEEHYDQRTEEQKRKLRRELFEMDG